MPKKLKLLGQKGESINLKNPREIFNTIIASAAFHDVEFAAVDKPVNFEVEAVKKDKDKE